MIYYHKNHGIYYGADKYVELMNMVQATTSFDEQLQLPNLKRLSKGSELCKQTCTGIDHNHRRIASDSTEQRPKSCALLKGMNKIKLAKSHVKSSFFDKICMWEDVM